MVPPALGTQEKLWITTQFWSLPVFATTSFTVSECDVDILHHLLAHTGAYDSVSGSGEPLEGANTILALDWISYLQLTDHSLEVSRFSGLRGSAGSASDNKSTLRAHQMAPPAQLRTNPPLIKSLNDASVRSSEPPRLSFGIGAEQRERVKSLGAWRGQASFLSFLIFSDLCAVPDF